MNITLVGYGKMGQAIHNVCKDRGHKVVSIVDPVAPQATVKTLKDMDIKNTDCVIDFSHPSVAIDNINFYIKNDIKAVIGTTGWYDAIPSLKLKSTSKILYSGNFSIGVALFLKVVEKAAAYFDKFADYDISVSEAHHNQKADSPSGTALMVAENITKNVKRKNEILIGNSDGKIKENQLQISSIRLGSTVGVHTAYFDSTEDTITLQHTAKNRNGFAKGSVDCAAWLIKTKKCGLLKLDDYLNDIL